jgi:hypothetical protein
MTADPSWHGWGFEGAVLSVAPSPDNARAIALILSQGGEHRVLGEFFSEWDAADAMAFLDGAFALTAEANQALLVKVAALGG